MNQNQSSEIAQHCLKAALSLLVDKTPIPLPDYPLDEIIRANRMAASKGMPSVHTKLLAILYLYQEFGDINNVVAILGQISQ